MTLVNNVIEKVLTVPEEICPIDFMIDLYKENPKYTFVLDKKCTSDLLLGRLPKVILRNIDGTIEISWIGKTDKMLLNEISETHQYEVVYLHMDNVNYEFDFDSHCVIILKR